MKVTKDLEELLKRIRLDHAEIVERFRFLDWSGEDARRLGAAAQYMAPSQQAFVDHLYRHLAEFSTPSALLRTPEDAGFHRPCGRRERSAPWLASSKSSE